jgi:hypothetical protein
MQSPAGFSEEKRVRALPLLQALESQRCAVLLTVVLSRIKVAKIYHKKLNTVNLIQSITSRRF